MLHTGQGHMHLNADLSILGIGSITSPTFKKREREIGVAVESFCRESCAQFREKERVECRMVDNDGDALISVVYERSKAQNSSTGFGTIIGESSGKVLDYGIKSTWCRKCD